MAHANLPGVRRDPISFLFSLLTYLLFPPFLLFFAVRLICKPEYRARWPERFGRYPHMRRHPHQALFWVHAVSVGEVLASDVFIRHLRARYPDVVLVVSTGTPTGQATARRRLSGVDHFIYFPFDFPWIVRRAVRTLIPCAFFCFETELWPHFLRALAREGSPAFLVNGRLSSKSFQGYHKARFFFRPALQSVSLFLMQTPHDMERIIALGAPCERVTCVGNIKYDQAISGSRGTETAPALRAALGIGDAPLMIAASLHPGEDATVLAAYARLKTDFPALVLLMAPRHLTRVPSVEQEVHGQGWTCVRKRDVDGPHDASVILLDTLGELAGLYAVGDVVFVGGSLVPVGGHNILEPAAFRKPTLFGPHMDNFQEIAEQMKQAGGGIEVANTDQMAERMAHLLTHPSERAERGEAAFRVVQDHQGAVERTLDRVAAWIK